MFFKTVRSYEYATQNWKNFMKNRLLALLLDCVSAGVVFLVAGIVVAMIQLSKF